MSSTPSPGSPSKWGHRHMASSTRFPMIRVREAHLAGRVAEALMAKAPDLLSASPDIKKLDVLAAKL